MFHASLLKAIVSTMAVSSVILQFLDAVRNNTDEVVMIIFTGNYSFLLKSTK